jgi:hypothetical protein
MSSRKQASQAAICPSARAEPGALLLGMVGEDGHVGYLKDRLIVDENFIAIAREQGPPEERFRFANTCVEGLCRQWDGKRCTVPMHVAPVLGTGEGDTPLHPCAIRTACRWFRQEGPSACRICPGVITDTPEMSA